MLNTQHTKSKPLRDFFLCTGVCAKILYLCRRPRVTQPKFVNALLSCFISHADYSAEYANHFLKCTKNVPTDITHEIREITTEKRSDILKNFENNVRPLLVENKVENIISALRNLIEKDVDIRGTTVISEIEGISKADLSSITHFYFTEFIVGILIYTIQNTVNQSGAICSERITDDYVEQFSDINSTFTWSWNMQTGDLGAIIAYAKKSLALNGLLELLKRDYYIDFFCVFGGVASKLIDDDTCALFSNWLSKNEKARLFLCYETGDAARGRARLLDPNKIRLDRLPSNPIQRMEIKEKNVQGSISKFNESVRQRVDLIPIFVPLNHHIILIEDEVYWNNLTENRSSENTTYKAENTPTGIKTKREQLEYIVRILTKNDDSNSDYLIQYLKKRIASLSATDRI